MRLLERNVELRFLGKLQNKDFLLLVPILHLNEPLIAGDSVVQMDNQIIVVQLAEILLGTACLIALLAIEQAAGFCLLVATEKFGIGENDDACGGDKETARQRS